MTCRQAHCPFKLFCLGHPVPPGESKVLALCCQICGQTILYLINPTLREIEAKLIRFSALPLCSKIKFSCASSLCSSCQVYKKYAETPT